MEREPTSPLALALIESAAVALVAWVPAGMLVVWIWPTDSAQGWWLGLLAWLALAATAFLIGYRVERALAGSVKR